MKKIVLIWLIIFSAVVFSQTMSVQKLINEKTDGRKSYPIDPRPFIERFNKVNGIDLSQPIENNTVLRKTTAWNFKVGDKKIWYSSNFQTNNFYQVPSTCRAVGNYCYIFVEDAIWNDNFQKAVNTVLAGFESSTPANPSKGIYQTVTETFGILPQDVDGDPRIIILILDIKDGYDGDGGYIAGYFHSYHEFTRDQYPYSNKAEIYFLDGVENNFSTDDGLQVAMSTTAHEFQHMIHFMYILDDETIFDEAWSLIAEVICGYPIYTQSYYAGESNQFFFEWRRTDPNVLIDYSRAARFALYLKEQFGNQIFKAYLENNIKAANGINTTLQKLGSSRRFIDILEDWFIANYLNDKSIDPKWGYDYSNLPKMKSKINANPNISSTSNVYKYGVQYITFNNGKDLNISFNNLGNDIKVKAIKIGNSIANVENVQVNTNYSVPDFGTTYNEITFAVYFVNQDISKKGPFKFSYTATGIFENRPIEIAYDYTEPIGVPSNLSIGDTVAVVFDGIQGTKLDSIRVALRNMVPIQGGVWSSTNQKILAKKYVDITVQGKTTPAVIDQNATYPYQIPYPNWVTVDLRNYNIDASSNFGVAFIINGIYVNSSSPTNRVMITSIPGQSAYHSYTYLNEPSGGKEPGWYYIGDGTNIALYLIRAYVTYKTSDNEEKVIELLPSTFLLEQNYPNPFNPSTIISYQIPEMSNVQIKIYDSLGKEVRTLVNETKSAGKYNILWDGRDNYGNRVASGVYFYKIIAGNFVQTKKMMLVK